MSQDLSNDDLYPLALLMDELKHDNVANRVAAMQKLDTISLALGPERTRNELIPFLKDVVQDDEEEVFAVLAEELGSFVPLVGGIEYGEVLLPVLQELANTEEPIVRDKAVNSLNEIASQFSIEQISKSFLPLIENLAQAEWFSSKSSSTGLFQSVILKVNDEERINLLNLYLKLIQDESPLVQRAAGKNLPTIINLFKEDLNLTNEKDWDLISTMFQSLSNDKQDSVKFLSIDVLISILQYFQLKNDKTFQSDLLNSALKLIQDPSWRVRYMCADRYEQIAINFKQDEDKILQLIDPFINLLKDNESEVRKAISKQLPGFCKLVDESVLLEKVLPQLEELSNDQSEVVRSALASEITNLTPLLSKENSIKYLLPIFLTMLKDENPEVKLNIISKLKIVNEIIGIDLLTNSLLPAITELARDKQWRVRLAIIEYIPLLAEQLGVEFFNEELGDLVLSWLWDDVYSIRDAAVLNLEKLATIFGSKWANDEIISRILKSDELFSNFAYRLTSLFTLTKLMPVIDNEINLEEILPFINSLTNDPVPNIRFNVAKSFLVAAKTLLSKENISDSSTNYVKEKILPSLEALQKDNDTDVRFFATQSIEGVKALLG